MKHLLSIFKVLYTFITELFGVILLPLILIIAIAGTVYLFAILPLTFLLYLVGVENYEVLVWIFFSSYGFAFWFCFYCYMFYEICWKNNDLQSLFSRLIRDIKKLSRNDNTSEFD